MTKNMKREALANLVLLGENPYPGDGIIVGMDETGENLVQVYWAMGNDEERRNRVLGHDHDAGCLYSEAADPSKAQHLSRVVYNAMQVTRNRPEHTTYVVGNGSHTDKVASECRSPIGDGLYQAMAHCSYQPDGLSCTSRIVAASSWRSASGTPTVQMCALRKSLWGPECNMSFNRIALGNFYWGFGCCLVAFGAGDFQNEPMLMPLEGDIRRVAATFWSALNQANRVAIAVKFIPRNGRSVVHVINKYSKKSSEDD